MWGSACQLSPRCFPALTSCHPRPMHPFATFRCRYAAACLLSSFRADSLGRCEGLWRLRRSKDPDAPLSCMSRSCQAGPPCVSLKLPPTTEKGAAAVTCRPSARLRRSWWSDAAVTGLLSPCQAFADCPAVCAQSRQLPSGGTKAWSARLYNFSE